MSMVTTMSEMFSRYQILSSLAKGTASRLYLASSLTAPEKQVVIKDFDSLHLSDPQKYRQFLEEVEKLKRLSHPHILPVLDAGIEKNRPYLVYPRAEHDSLGDLLRRTSPLSCEEAVRLLSQIGQALACAHERGIIHGNLKPENVLFNGANDALLSDFRLKSLAKNNVYRVDTRSACYMAPEQFTGGLSQASDQYGLACMAYELLTGRVPFSALTSETLRTRHRQDKPMPLSLFITDLPVYVEAAILRAMAKKPVERHANMAAFISALIGATPPQEYAAPAANPVEETPDEPEEPAFGTMASMASASASAATGGVPPLSVNNFAQQQQSPVAPGLAPQTGSFAAAPPTFTPGNNPTSARISNLSRRIASKRPERKLGMTARGWVLMIVAGLAIVSMAVVPFLLASQSTDKNVQVATATPSGQNPTDVATSDVSPTVESTVAPTATPKATPTPRKPTPTVPPAPTAGPVTPSNGGFESPDAGSNSKGYIYNPGNAGWQFSSNKNAGVSAGGSTMTTNNGAAPEGAQVGFVQSHGTISQSLNMSAGTYKVVFYGAEGGFTFSAQTVQVSIDGKVVLSVNLNKTGYAQFSSSSFTMTTGAHTLQFAGTSDWDQSVGLIDQVNVVLA